MTDDKTVPEEDINTFFISCPKGFEDLLLDELQSFGATDCKLTTAGVYAQGTKELGYKACLCSRVANRVFYPLLDSQNSGYIDNDYDLYSAVYSLDWENHIDPKSTFIVDFTGTNQAIKNSQFGAMRAKDALVDRLLEKAGLRPDVDKDQPDIRINVRLNKNKLSVAIDLSGESLHRRGYRLEQGVAPLKENVAAALLLRAGWTKDSTRPNLIDPMCGSGTFLIEGALMALGLAPGLYRERFGFEKWLKHDESCWLSLLNQEQALFDVALDNPVLRFWGYDENPAVLVKAESNIEKAGLSEFIDVSCRSLTDFELPNKEGGEGLLICNPPYGERLGDVEMLKGTYKDLGAIVKSRCPGWKLSVLTSNEDLAREMRLRPKRKNRFLNGPISSLLLSYDLLEPDKAKLRQDPEESDELSAGAAMVVNRLTKNLRRLDKWRSSSLSNAYRVYDADMPEYAAAIDVYGDKLHIQEYAAPKTVNETAAKKRLRDLVLAVKVVFDKDDEQIFIKVRKQNKGKEQYQKFDSKGQLQEQILEGKAKFWVNLSDYLDTGVFLDHRKLRLRIGQEAIGKSFLNLFCYTATASVHAALGGAKDSVSVDMSKTYLEWAKQNYELNRINQKRHQLVQEDCIKWLNSCRQGFDLVMLDPPTFSNSKKMEGVLDIQKDHASLIKRCMELLRPSGKLYFSNNLRSFKLDDLLLEKYSVRDITSQTIDEDFSRNKKIHQCFLIENK